MAYLALRGGQQVSGHVLLLLVERINGERVGLRAGCVLGLEHGGGWEQEPGALLLT